MEPEGSLPRPLETASGRYPQPDKFSPAHSHHISLRAVIVSFHLHLGLPNGLLTSVFPAEIAYYLQ